MQNEKRGNMPSEQDYDEIVSPCGSAADSKWWCDIHDSRWGAKGGPCDWRLDFQDSVERLLEILNRK